MQDKFFISKKGRNAIVAVAAGVFVCLAIFSFMATRSLINKPFPGFLVFKNNLVTLITLAEWEGPKNNIKPRDIVVAVNGQPVKTADELYTIVTQAGPGTPLTYTIDRGKQRIEKTVPVSIFTSKDFFTCYSIWTSIGLVVLAMGLVVFFLNPNSPASWSYLTLGIVIGVTTTTIWEQCATHINHAPLYVFPLYGPSIFLIGLHFPVTSRFRKYLIPFIVITTIPVIFFYRYSFSDPFFYRTVDTIFLVHLITNCGLGVVVMVHSFITSRDSLTRQKGKIVVYGFVLAFIVSLCVFFGAFFLEKINFAWISISVFILLSSLGYAIVKRNLFDVDVLILRSASYFVVTGIVVLLFFTLIGTSSLLFQNLTGQSSQIIAVIITLFMVAIFRPLQTRVDSYLSRKFFREKYRYRETIREASKVLVSIIEVDQLLHQILDTILNAMKIKKGVVLLKQKEGKAFELAAARIFTAELDSTRANDEQVIDSGLLELSNPVFEVLQMYGRPIQIDDLKKFYWVSNYRDTLYKFFYALEAVLIIPIIYERRLIGILGLDAKLSEELYSREDNDLLQTLMMQTAVSIENALKVKELKSMVELEASNRELAMMGITLEKTSSEWRNTFDSIPDMIMLVDRDYRIIRANRSTVETFGQSFKELIGQPYYAMVYVSSAPPDYCPLYQSITDGREHVDEIQLAGTKRDFLCTATPIIDDSGKLTASVFILRDITEKKKMEREVIKTQKLESLGMLSGGIAHDFNNALAGILVNISHAKKVTKDNDLAVELLVEAERATLGARRLSEQLLTFSKGGEPIKEVASIGNLLKESIKFIMRGSDLECDLSIPDDLWLAVIDKVQINQVIHNLVINAMQVSTSGSTIKVMANNILVDDDNTPPPQGKGKYVMVSIKDEGKGISDNNITKIFDPFFTTKEEGSGLGLSTSYSIINKHGGMITVDSEEGYGATFNVFLPASTENISKSDTEEEYPELVKSKILLMEDDAVIRNGVRKILESIGCEVETAPDGDEAVELYTRAMKSGRQFDAVILDLTVPGGVGGEETIQKLLDMDPAVKAIVASGYSNDKVLTNFREYGFQDVIRKPYEVGTLVKALNNLIEAEE